MKVFIEASSSLKKFFQENNEIEINDGNCKVTDLLKLCSIPSDEVGIIIINGVKSSLDDTLNDSDKIKLFPPIIAG